ncbi:MAG TPA: protein-export chaperone SecB [Pyrinomonadaceae bacterium]|jgi:preprotein translocase subunit SecB|nr:protein-export chaperone SecB [Pyrinomonadaceae bacterium]
MQLSRLALDDYFIKALSFALSSGFDQDREEGSEVEPPDLKVRSRLQHLKNKQWRCELRVELPSDPAGKFPYAFGLTLVGLFSIEKELSPDSDETLARSNAPAVLFSAAREVLASVSSRSGFPPFLLPTVTFAYDKQKNLPTSKIAPKASRKKSGVKNS